MFTSTVFLLALAGIARAQTPQGFTPSVNTKLDVFFNSTSVATPGQRLKKATTASQPQLALPATANVSSSDSYIFVMIDLDVPPAEGQTTRRTILHAMITDFKATSQAVGSSGSRLLASQEKGPAAYIGPSPPATDSTPHRYVELLFQQPAQELSVSEADFEDIQSRIGFEIEQFAQQNGLGEPLAANFFTVSGQPGGGASGTAGSFGTATGSGGIVRNTLAPEEFEGRAGRVDFSLGFAGLVGGLVLAVV
ncbi:PEBP-like protein [Aaosphaeria arxii CBS 175.79]|uniref:PEBP-like protein n=1 Tax=Aaosphaeria arxii CBS 175.79 TaxID=1450172 RepID=A0A6A5Y7Q3_9PLEO|nr:PEBP-like protein [Aaosphaeria arxii CBS 175.79]KAF2021326.1 PEBP-like protein [Aaosphaeria arxii CBS 175.79]